MVAMDGQYVLAGEFTHSHCNRFGHSHPALAWPQMRYALWALVFIKLIIPPTWEMPTSIVSWIKPQVEEQISDLPSEARGILVRLKH